MKKYLITSFGLLVLPLFLFAAFDDVTLTTDAIINVGGSDFTVSGSSAEVESIVVNENDFTVTLQSGSAFTISDSGRNLIDVNKPVARTCTATESTAVLSGVNITLTVSHGTQLCSGAAASTSSGSGGGGAPGTIIPVPPTPPDLIISATPAVSAVPTVVPSVSAVPSPAALSVSPVFNRTLRIGMSHVDIKRLQQLLNADSDTKVASSGVGSSGNETNYYGALTQKAVQKFQIKHGIVSSGTPTTTGFGLAGPKTRAKLQEVFESNNEISEPEKRVQLQAQIDELNQLISDLLERLQKFQ